MAGDQAAATAPDAIKASVEGKGGSGQHNGRKENFSKNNKSRQYEAAESSDPDGIRDQVEFYLGDSNLPFDKFLLGQTGASKNNPIPIKTIHNFKRMRHFQPYSAVVAALRESKKLDVHPSADEAADKADETVSRKEPISSDYTADDVEKNENIYNEKTLSRSIYVKGFGGYSSEEPSTQRDIEAYFAPYSCNAVRLRRTFKQIFKGSVFVEFEDDDAAEQFLRLEDTPLYNGEPLTIVMSKADYLKKKEAEKEKLKELDEDGNPKMYYHKGQLLERGSSRGGRGRGNTRGGRGGRGRGGGHKDNGARPANGKATGEKDGGEHGKRGADGGKKRKRDETDGDDTTARTDESKKAREE